MDTYIYPDTAPEPEPPHERLISTEMIFHRHTALVTRKLPAVCANVYRLINGSPLCFCSRWYRPTGQEVDVFPYHSAPLPSLLISSSVSVSYT